jgi:hypothetical protein
MFVQILYKVVMNTRQTVVVLKLIQFTTSGGEIVSGRVAIARMFATTQRRRRGILLPSVLLHAIEDCLQLKTSVMRWSQASQRAKDQPQAAACKLGRAAPAEVAVGVTCLWVAQHRLGVIGLRITRQMGPIVE